MVEPVEMAAMELIAYAAKEERATAVEEETMGMEGQAAPVAMAGISSSPIPGGMT